MAITTNIDTMTVHCGRFKLPSCGILYRSKGREFPEELEISAFGFEVEDILLQPDTGLRKLIRVVQHVVKNFPPGFDPETIIPGDLYVIIAVARALTYGENYRFKPSCPECGHPEVITIKVPDELPIKDWSRYAAEAELVRDLTITLPGVKDNVVLSPPPSVKEELSLEQFKRKSRAAGGGSDVDGRVYAIASRIASVNGGVPDALPEAIAYVRRLRGPDMLAIGDAIEASDCGIDLSWTILCDKCQHSYETAIPLNLDFFRRNRV